VNPREHWSRSTLDDESTSSSLNMSVWMPENVSMPGSRHVDLWSVMDPLVAASGWTSSEHSSAEIDRADDSPDTGAEAQQICGLRPTRGAASLAGSGRHEGEPPNAACHHVPPRELRGRAL